MDQVTHFAHFGTPEYTVDDIFWLFLPRRRHDAPTLALVLYSALLLGATAVKVELRSRIDRCVAQKREKQYWLIFGKGLCVEWQEIES
jgi:hypothetical protein